MLEDVQAWCLEERCRDVCSVRIGAEFSGVKGEGEGGLLVVEEWW